jgi:hypothetical protein
MDLSATSKKDESSMTKARRAEISRLITGAKTYEELCTTFGVDVEKARKEAVDDIYVGPVSAGYAVDGSRRQQERSVDYGDKEGTIEVGAGVIKRESVSSTFAPFQPGHERIAMAI